MHARVCHRTVTYANDEGRSRTYPLVDGHDGPSAIYTDDGVRLERVMVFTHDEPPVRAAVDFTDEGEPLYV
jgi:hypothetical protein